MRLADTQHNKLVLVCVNMRADGRECCAQKGSVELYEKLKTAVKEVCEKRHKGWRGKNESIRVSRSYCLDNCASGITVALMPQNIYLAEVTEVDIPEIIKKISEP